MERITVVLEGLFRLPSLDIPASFLQKLHHSRRTFVYLLHLGCWQIIWIADACAIIININLQKCNDNAIENACMIKEFLQRYNAFFKQNSYSDYYGNLPKVNCNRMDRKS